MKKLVTSTMVLVMSSTLALAQNQPSTTPDICRGEVSKEVVSGVANCSDEQLARSLYELQVLETELDLTQAQLLKAFDQKGANGLSYKDADSIEVISTLGMLFGGISSFIITGINATDRINGFKISKGAKIWTAGSYLTLAMSLAGYKFAEDERERLQIQFKDIPVFIKSIKVLKSQINVRKTLINQAIQSRIQQ